MRGRCKRCKRAGELFSVSRANCSGTAVIRERLCEHCALHDDTPAVNCEQCFSEVSGGDLMPKYVVEHVCSDGSKRYLIWSTIVDAPLTFGATLIQIYEAWGEMYGNASLVELLCDIDRRGFDKLDDVIACNRAGDHETRLTREQIIDFYFERQGRGDRPVGVSWQQGDD